MKNQDTTRDTEACSEEQADELDELVLKMEQRLIDRVRRGQGLRHEIERIARREGPTFVAL